MAASARDPSICMLGRRRWAKSKVLDRALEGGKKREAPRQKRFLWREHGRANNKTARSPSENLEGRRDDKRFLVRVATRIGKAGKFALPPTNAPEAPALLQGTAPAGKPEGQIAVASSPSI